MEASAPPPSKFALTDLTMRSMIELERVRSGLDYEPDVLLSLSCALLGSGHADDGGSPSFAFIEPSLYEPYARAVRDLHVDDQSAMARIGSYIRSMSAELSMVAAGDVGPVPELIPACVRLHRELIMEINLEEAFDVGDWPALPQDA